MLLEKPQSEAVETILKDCYNAGRNAVIQALADFHEICPRKGIVSFLEWYSENNSIYEMKFKVGE